MEEEAGEKEQVACIWGRLLAAHPRPLDHPPQLAPEGGLHLLQVPAVEGDLLLLLLMEELWA